MGDVDFDRRVFQVPGLDDAEHIEGGLGRVIGRQQVLGGNLPGSVGRKRAEDAGLVDDPACRGGFQQGQQCLSQEVRRNRVGVVGTGQSVGVMPSDSSMTPALLTRMSSRPNCDRKNSGRASRSAASVTSSLTVCASMPSSFSVSAAAWPFWVSREPRTTVMPCLPELAGDFQADAFICAGNQGDFVCVCHSDLNGRYAKSTRE